MESVHNTDVAELSEFLLNTSVEDLLVDLFKRKDFEFICKQDDKVHVKAWEALDILCGNQVRELLYGGAAGGGKSWIGCSWLLFSALSYPGTKWFVGREDLQRIKKSTLVTFNKVRSFYGLDQDVYTYNGQENILKFKNGSQIDLLNLQFQPRDELYERFGSLEYTGGWIEEGGEVNFGAFDVLKTRVGRHYNDKYNLKPIIFVTCNPKKNWIYSYFYKPDKEKTIPDNRRFLQAFVFDNPFIESDYIEQLKSTTDKSKKERLLNGNWDYDDNPYKLVPYDKILALWTNTHLVKDEHHWLTADIARFGSDKARIGVWLGWTLVEVVSFDISKTTEIQNCILALMQKYQIPKERAIADDDGVGGGVVDNCGIVGFVNGSAPFDEIVSEEKKDRPRYKNLQTQCLVGLADKIIKNEILVDAELSEIEKEEIKQELDTIERIPDSDTVVQLVPKKEIKVNIGRSPDWRDLFLMRKWFDYGYKEYQGQSHLFSGGF